ncbi:hypothetical protein FPOG_02260 [Fusobacterium periodonticum D10]|uniref:Uncharacterized protein n=1 Tax=Fusobacterium periodonticum D10 TaxID=620833 RepID=K1GDY5_9FUSO|nr:hypothetical protein FPOG_02260 [Fusobacterium periodonticum D10]
MKDNLQRLKIKYIIFITIFFTILYKGAEFYTRTLDYVPSYLWLGRKKLPFLTIFMLPYMTSAPFFFGTFLTIKDEKKIKLLCKTSNIFNCGFYCNIFYCSYEILFSQT